MENIEKQLSEIELLQSIFFCENEFKVINENEIQTRKQFIEGEGSIELINSIDIELNISICDTQVNVAVEIPVDYPEAPFNFLIRCSDFTKQQHMALNSESLNYISNLDSDTISVNAFIDWLRENLPKYLLPSVEVVKSESPSTERSYSRLWIYSHHLYSKIKKANIKEWCRDMNLDGFFLSGKPGIICVEGTTSETNMFWWNIRQMNWKRLVLKDQELVKLDSATEEVIQWKKFSEFKEVVFPESRDKADFSLFIKWLKNIDCEHYIPILFGIDIK